MRNFRDDDDFDTNPPNFFRDEKENDKLIVIDNVSDLADCSYTFASFLTVTRKFWCSSIYLWFIRKKTIWKLMLSQIQMINLFPAHLDLSSSSINILSINWIRGTFHYIPKKRLWFNRLFLDLSRENSVECLILDFREINKRGPSKFRTKADHLEKQRRFLNISSNDKQYNTYLS